MMFTYRPSIKSVIKDLNEKTERFWRELIDTN